MNAPYRDETETLHARIRALEEENATLVKRGKAKPAKAPLPLNGDDAFGLRVAVAVCLVVLAVFGVGTLAHTAGASGGHATAAALCAGAFTGAALAIVRLWQARP
jgi:hypothetical protein